MTDNAFKNTPLPWGDSTLDREFNDVSGNSTTVKMSESLDRTLMFVSKTNNQTMAAYIKGAITKALQADIALIQETTDPVTLQQSLASMLNKRKDTRVRKQKTTARNKSNKEPLASSE